MAFSDIPVRSNSARILASWFNLIRSELISAFGTVTGQTSASILDNQSSAVNLGSLNIEGATYSGATVEYEIERSDGGGDDRFEKGSFQVYYKGSTWYLVYSTTVGDNALGGTNQFSISTAGTVGHIQYTSDSMGGTYTGTCKYKVTYFDQ